MSNTVSDNQLECIIAQAESILEGDVIEWQSIAGFASDVRDALRAVLEERK